MPRATTLLITQEFEERYLENLKASIIHMDAMALESDKDGPSEEGKAGLIEYKFGKSASGSRRDTMTSDDKQTLSFLRQHQQNCRNIELPQRLHMPTETPPNNIE